MTYIVMENNISFSVVLDEDGRFINVANMGYETGQTINYIIPLTENKKSFFTRKSIFAFYGIAACFLFSLIFYYQNITTTIYGSVYLTINPQIKMEINKNAKVRNLLALNEDGKVLIENINAKGTDVSQISNILIDKSIKLGILTNGGEINMSIETQEDEKWFEKIGIDLRENVGLYVDNKNMDITVKIFKFEKNADDDKENMQKKESLIPPDIIPIQTEQTINTSKPTTQSTNHPNAKPTPVTTVPNLTSTTVTTAPTPKPVPITIAPTATPKPVPITIAPTATPKPVPITIAPTATPKPTPITIVQPTLLLPELEFTPTPVLNNDDDNNSNNNNDDDDDNDDDSESDEEDDYDD